MNFPGIQYFCMTLIHAKFSNFDVQKKKAAIPEIATINDPYLCTAPEDSGDDAAAAPLSDEVPLADGSEEGVDEGMEEGEDDGADEGMDDPLGNVAAPSRISEPPRDGTVDGTDDGNEEPLGTKRPPLIVEVEGI